MKKRKLKKWDYIGFISLWSVFIVGKLAGSESHYLDKLLLVLVVLTCLNIYAVISTIFGTEE
ncbi:hypothetical protein LP7551_05414 [Roseibium album]|nr:hypothetical protein LP7551_05414 [Roseibium album]